MLPHVPYYAYGENIAVLEERKDAISLSAAYERFFARLVDSDFAWEKPRPLQETQAAALDPTHAGKTEAKYDVFLLYAASDVAAVERLDARLREYGMKSFFSKRDLLPGQDSSESLSAAWTPARASWFASGLRE